MKYIFSRKEKVGHLIALEGCLGNLIGHLYKTGIFPERVGVYEDLQRLCREYIENGFSQQDLNELGHNLPDLFARHKEWTPPFDGEPDQYGRTVDAIWFKELEAVLQPVLGFAYILPAIGERVSLVTYVRKSISRWFSIINEEKI